MPAWDDARLLEYAARREAGEPWSSITPGEEARSKGLLYKAKASGRLAGLQNGGALDPAPVSYGRETPNGAAYGAATVAAPVVERTAPTVHRWRVPAERAPNWEHWTLVISDVHYDNPHCRRDLLRWYLDQARARRAGVCVIGDMACAMQGRYDPRSAKGDTRPEYMRDDYLWALVEYQAALIAEYPDLTWFLSDGNHETNILKRLEFDLTAATAREANTRRGAGAPPVATGTYAGWIIWEIVEPGGYRQERVTHYDHGSGGGGPVTKGVIGSNRRAVYAPDAHEVWTGHIHEAWYMEITRERASVTGTTLDVQQHVCLGTLKEERLPGRGYHVERGRPPKPLGGWWRRLYYSHLAPAGYRCQWIRTEW